MITEPKDNHKFCEATLLLYRLGSCN